MNVEVALIVRTVSVDVKQIARTVSVDVNKKTELNRLQLFRAQELCESRGGRPRFPIPSSPYSLCGLKVKLN